MAPAVLPVAELIALPEWRTADFISDLHLHASEPATFGAWRAYLASTPAEAVFILGDLFEAWVGDDAAWAPANEFESACAGILAEAASRRAVFFMHGNRDFLVGQKLLGHAGVTLLADPTVLAFGGQRWLLSHGDLLCLEDRDYLAFRAVVRSDEWQREFLARPLEQRQLIARGLRAQSEARKASGAAFADIDTVAAREWLHGAQALTLIHGHTHRPRDHDLGSGMRRIVLSDWDLAATPPRAEVLRLTADGHHRLWPGP